MSSFPYYSEMDGRQLAYYPQDMSTYPAQQQRSDYYYQTQAQPSSNLPLPAVSQPDFSKKQQQQPLLAHKRLPTPPPSPPQDPARGRKSRNVRAGSGLNGMHQCSECPAKYERPCDLKKHKKNHDRIYKCDEPDCRFFIIGFASDKDLGRHCWECHGRAPYAYPDFPKPELQYCNQPGCTHICKRLANLKTHMEDCHGIPYIRTKGPNKGKDMTVVKGTKSKQTRPDAVLGTDSRVSKMSRVTPAPTTLRRSARLEAAIDAVAAASGMHGIAPYPKAGAGMVSPPQSPKLAQGAFQPIAPSGPSSYNYPAATGGTGAGVAPSSFYSSHPTGHQSHHSVPNFGTSSGAGASGYGNAPPSPPYYANPYEHSLNMARAQAAAAAANPTVPSWPLPSPYQSQQQHQHQHHQSQQQHSQQQYSYPASNGAAQYSTDPYGASSGHTRYNSYAGRPSTGYGAGDSKIDYRLLQQQQSAAGDSSAAPVTAAAAAAAAAAGPSSTMAPTSISTSSAGVAARSDGQERTPKRTASESSLFSDLLGMNKVY